MSGKSTSVVDANAFLALLLGRERVPYHQSWEFFEPVRDYRGVSTESQAVRHALTLYRDRNVDFVDALVAATAAERKWRVFSFDRDLERLTK